MFLSVEEQRPTVLQPDLFAVCDPKKTQNDGCHGAPDFVIGVREIWFADPDRRQKVRILRQADGRYAMQPALDAGSIVSAEVLDDCQIDLSPVFDE